MKPTSNRLAYRRVFNELILAVDREYNHAYLNLYNWKTGFITWTDDENKLRWVQLRRYDKFFLRLAAKENSPPPRIVSCFLMPNCEFELTFVSQESRAIADDLAERGGRAKPPVESGINPVRRSFQSSSRRGL
jgi:hypothetical protein